MKLKNQFTQDTRNLYLYRNDCDICGQNGTDCGGLEIHHIIGRKSNSPLNVSILCKKDHSQVGHTRDEEQKLFAKNLQFLFKEDYVINAEDMEFLKKFPYLIENNPYLPSVDKPLAKKI